MHSSSRDSGPAFVIAEAGVNHNGSLDLALQLVDVAAAARADAVKFQTFRAEKLISRSARKADYQVSTTGAQESQLDMIKRLALDDAMHERLIEHCKARGIMFMSTPFDDDSTDLLAKRLRVSRLKISSGAVTNPPFLLHAARTGLPMIVSTGMSSLGEVETMLGVLAFGYARPGGAEPSMTACADAYASSEGQAALRERVTLLHCTTEYPSPFESVNLRAMDVLQSAFGLPVGLSDHTPGISIPLAAVARGACVIEKHVTLDRTLPGPDHQASIEPAELNAMVKGIREVEAALGDGRKVAAACEISNRAIARQSLVAACAVRAGERWTRENLAIKRPGTGISPLRYWELLGREAKRDYAPDELLDP